MVKFRGVALIAALAVFFYGFSVNEYAYAAGAETAAAQYEQEKARETQQVKAQETSHTQDEALAWARSQLGELIDVDGWYGAQCVDLIYAYYEYLGVGRRGGNGTDYQNDDKLPDGWERLWAEEGAVPQPGDVVVWAGGAHGIRSADGHVGIIDSVDAAGNFNTLEQNYGADRSVTLNPRKAGEFTCVLRPNWKPDPEDVVRECLNELKESMF